MKRLLLFLSVGFLLAVNNFGQAPRETPELFTYDREAGVQTAEAIPLELLPVPADTKCRGKRIRRRLASLGADIFFITEGSSSQSSDRTPP